MSITWIRHGEKNFTNGNAPEGQYNHDPSIKEDVKDKIIPLCVNINEKYGIPEKIICSPFSRTRETAYLIRDYFITHHSKSIGIYIDNSISEFLGWGKPKGLDADISPSTKFFIKPQLGIEKLKDLRKRSLDHLNSIDINQNIIIITHGIVICYIYNHLTGEKLNRIKELNGINLKGGMVNKLVF